MIARKAIALLITLLFIVAITISVGIGLKQTKEASKSVNGENFMLQTSIILDDVLTLLKTSKELGLIGGENGKEILNGFLSQSSFIPFEAGDVKVLLEIKSARDRLNINTLKDTNQTAEAKKKVKYRVETFKDYINNNGVNLAYADMVLDLMGGIKGDMTYNSDIFYEKPNLFRDYVTSFKHLAELDDFYMKTYHDNKLKDLKLDKIFFCNKNKKTRIDLNYATAEVWEFILNTDIEKANELALGAGGYEKLEDLDLSDEEKLALNNFDISYFEPFLDVHIEIIQNKNVAKIHFEYDIKKRKGSNFSYEI